MSAGQGTKCEQSLQSFMVELDLMAAEGFEEIDSTLFKTACFAFPEAEHWKNIHLPDACEYSNGGTGGTSSIDYGLLMIL